jgi:hypothetical protein
MGLSHIVSRSPDGRRSLSLALLLAFALLLASGCGRTATQEPPEPTGGLTARQVLEGAVDDFMSLDSYRYRGTSGMAISGMEGLDSESGFDTVLVRNGQGAMDGHMVVTSDQAGGSYETYSWRGTEYTRLEGGDWYRVDRGAEGGGYGLVSLDARRIIAGFAELAEDVRMVEETGSEYVISLVMGPRYFQGAADIAGEDPDGSSAGGASDITMTISVDKRTLRMKRISMTSSTPASADTPQVTVVTEGEYSGFNQPVDIEPPPEALDAPYLDSGNPVP